MEKDAFLKSLHAAAYLAEKYFPCTPDALLSFCRSGTGPSHARFRGQYLFRVGDLDTWASAQISYVPYAPRSWQAVEAVGRDIVSDNVTKFPSDGRRSRQFNFRVTPEVYETIHRLAAQQKQSAADFLIFLVECADSSGKKSASA